MHITKSKRMALLLLFSVPSQCHIESLNTYSNNKKQKTRTSPKSMQSDNQATTSTLKKNYQTSEIKRRNL